MANLDKQMKRHGIEPNEVGQFEFADVVFYDEKMHPTDKLFWLRECKKEGQDVGDKIEFLKEISQ